ncbi:unnamed protein product [Caenorhabditis bovis]|uniref:RRM domain-containing protein n=1 Tax=Caenorhabditis bovis TaxID=2654633 RepID=A0A8S1EPH2_9PELO|nr:unnamed protein product [Caenorhabditis bovis]
MPPVPGQNPQQYNANMNNHNNQSRNNTSASSGFMFPQNHMRGNFGGSGNNNGYGRYTVRDGTPQQNDAPLSSTNLYIRGLAPSTTDENLRDLCQKYGSIASTKAIMDKTTNLCKGYGFVDFESPHSAQSAVEGLNQDGIQAQMAKLQQQEQDPTNLYIANLPLEYNEQKLEAELNKFGMVISTRILRDANQQSRGVGFARMDSKEKCEEIISALNGGRFEGMPPEAPALLIKQADTGRKSNRGPQKKGPLEGQFDASFYQNPHMMGSQGMQYPQVYQSYYPYTVYPQYDVNSLSSHMGGMQIGGGQMPQGANTDYSMYPVQNVAGGQSNAGGNSSAGNQQYYMNPNNGGARKMKAAPPM